MSRHQVAALGIALVMFAAISLFVQGGWLVVLGIVIAAAVLAATDVYHPRRA